VHLTALFGLVLSLRENVSLPFVSELSIALLTQASASAWLLKVVFHFPESFCRGLLRQWPTPWFHLNVSLGLSVWPAVAITVSGEFLYNYGSFVEAWWK